MNAITVELLEDNDRVKAVMTIPRENVAAVGEQPTASPEAPLTFVLLKETAHQSYRTLYVRQSRLWLCQALGWDWLPREVLQRG